MPAQEGAYEPRDASEEFKDILDDADVELGKKLELAAATREAANLIVESLKGGSAAEAVRGYLTSVELNGGDVGEAKKALAERLAELAKAKKAVAEGEEEDPAAAPILAEAAEIDSLARSLEAKSEVTTEAGKEYLAKLDSGEFKSLEEALYALDGIKKGADVNGTLAEQRAAQEAINAEFNLLYAKAQEKFGEGQPPQSGQQPSGESLLGEVDEDVDDLFGKLTG